MPATVLRFTKKAIAALPATRPETQRAEYRDEEARHLRLFVTPAGSKTFYCVRKANGKTVFLKLGRLEDLSIAEARARCVEEGAKLAKGEDPRRPKAETFTFGELFARYMEGHAKPHKRTWAEDQRKHDTLFSHWDRKPVEAIDPDTVTRLHTRLGKDRGRYLANRTLALLKVVFNYGIDTLRLKLDNPCRGVKPFKEMSRDRFLSRDELKAFFEALESEKTPELWRDFFSLALYTGARRANVCAMCWEHLDLRAQLWRIPGEEFKNGEAFTVPLTAPALDILTRRKLDSDGKSPYVFPARGATGHVTEPRKAWRNLLKRAGLVTKAGKPTVRVHDLRRTLGSWQAATGASLQVIGKTLGHRDIATSAVYARLDLDPVKASMDTATAAMLAAANGGADNE